LIKDFEFCDGSLELKSLVDYSVANGSLLLIQHLASRCVTLTL